MIFGFRLYATLLLVILVVYFGIGLGNLGDEKLLEDGKMYSCQHWE